MNQNSHNQLPVAHKDIFWDFITPDGEKLQWSVYNDPSWLNCFVLNPNYNRKTDSKGRTWEIDFKKGLITQIFNS